ncbi:MAG: tetratricopeptide repeat protein [Polymorphobacter sp.]
MRSTRSFASSITALPPRSFLDLVDDNSVFLNGADVQGAPAFRLLGNVITFTNTASITNPDPINGLPPVFAIDLVGTGSTIINTATGTIGLLDTAAIRGSSGSDRIENAGLLAGLIELGDGNDTIVTTSGRLSNADIRLGDGDDRFINSLASVAYRQGDAASAEGYYAANIEIDEKVLGPNHPDLATTLNNLGRLQLERGAFAEARKSLGRAVAISLPERGPLHDDMAFQFANLALAEQGLGHHADAEVLFEKALAAGRRHDHRNIGPILVDLAHLQCRSKRVASGRALIVEGVARIAEDYPDEPWRTAWAKVIDGECAWHAGDRTTADRMIRDNAPQVLRRWPVDSYYGAETMRRLALLDGAN